MQIPLSRLIPPLTFLHVAEYSERAGHVNDYSETPRPHNCISVFLEGKASFEGGGKTIEMTPGDVIFVPWQSLYISHFTAPVTRFLTVHCNFAPSEFIFNSFDYPMQKLRAYEGLVEDFSFMRDNIGKTDFSALEVMQRFYGAMSRILPALTPEKAVTHNDSILAAIDYMENHFSEEMTCSELARVAMMSKSRFYSEFKRETGLTPVDYKNHIRMRHAVNMLYGDASVEEITTLLGFNSSAYFRRVFRRSTGYNPLEYKKKVLGRCPK